MGLCSPGLDPVLDQPNRAVRTRMLRGVGGAISDGRPYPDLHEQLKQLFLCSLYLLQLLKVFGLLIK